MRKSVLLIPLLSLWAALAPNLAFAHCPDKGWFKPGWLIEYHGAIANEDRIGMTLIFDGNSLNGVYFHATDFKDIKVKGEITGDSKFELDAYDASGKVIDTFTGAFAEHEASLGFAAPLTCEVMLGQWQHGPAGKPLPFKLMLDHAGGGVIGDSLVDEAPAQAFWRAVRDDDKKTVASLIQYPLKVSEDLTIMGPDEFIAHYDEIITHRKEEILAGLPHHMATGDLGVALGAGAVWFNGDGRAFWFEGMPTIDEVPSSN